MSQDPPTTGEQVQDQNNQNHDINSELPFPIMFTSLTETEMQGFLHVNHALHGLLINDSSGPIRSKQQVAMFKGGGYYSATWIREVNNLKLETINTQSERDSNYVHLGWSLSAVATQTPWISARIARENQTTEKGRWTTRRATLQRLRVEIAQDDLMPKPGFEQEIKAALMLSTMTEKIVAVHEALNRWGDVVPLLYDFGISISFTDLAENIDTDRSWWGINYSLLGTTRFNMEKRATPNFGGSARVIVERGFGEWMYQEVDAKEWSLTRIHKVLPTFQLLEKDLQEELADLHSKIISFSNVQLSYCATEGGITWDDCPHALKCVNQLHVHCGDRINGLSLVYKDGTQSNSGGTGDTKHSFELAVDEHITDILTWADSRILYGIQFITTKNRLSPHYGGAPGTPALLTAGGGILAGFSGLLVNENDQDSMRRLQVSVTSTVVRLTRLATRIYTEYIGGSGGGPFNDWEYSGGSHNAYISSIDVQCGSQIDGIQFTYTDKSIHNVHVTKAPYHGVYRELETTRPGQFLHDYLSPRTKGV
ncbi:Jacalin-like lectin domain protein [Ceratobasidium sp. AG-Ba]|nr:Jacalin-like lectin domain protein [Ceratobasidium sp. AG-Ba]